MLKAEKVEKILRKSSYNFDDLCSIMEILRGEGGCPWDAEQTHESIRKNFIEETYEVIEAIDNRDYKLLREELGDVLLQVVFHTQMEKEAGNFNINDVSNEVCVKLIHRHPHIFGDVVADSAEEVLNNWEAIKNLEKSRETVYDKVSSVPPMLPALMRASKVAKKSGEYKDIDQCEIIKSIKDLLDDMEGDITNDKVGELLFAVSALAYKVDIDPEEALFKSTNKYVNKFKS